MALLNSWKVSRLCLEVSKQPRLLPTFMRIVAMVPSTVAKTHGSERLAA